MTGKPSLKPESSIIRFSAESSAVHCLRRYRLHLVIMACAHLLFMQLALAQYICPGMGTAMAMPMPQKMEGSALIECPQAAHGDRAALCMCPSSRPLRHRP